MSGDDSDRPRRDAPEQKIDPTVAENQSPSASAQIRHTLRTPLNHIIGYSEMLLEEAGERALEALLPLGGGTAPEHALDPAPELVVVGEPRVVCREARIRGERVVAEDGRRARHGFRSRAIASSRRAAS